MLLGVDVLCLTVRGVELRYLKVLDFALVVEPL